MTKPDDRKPRPPTKGKQADATAEKSGPDLEGKQSGSTAPKPGPQTGGNQPDVAAEKSGPELEGKLKNSTETQNVQPQGISDTMPSWKNAPAFLSSDSMVSLVVCIQIMITHSRIAFNLLCRYPF